MIATKNKIGIFYRYNKHQPINGSLFYALEYYFTLRDTIDKINNDNSILNRDPLEHEVTLYWIFPKKLISTKENKEKFKLRLLRLAATKYPINFKWLLPELTGKRAKTKNSINKIIEGAKEGANLNEDQIADITNTSNTLGNYFKDIEIISETDLLRIQTTKSLFISQNTVHDCLLKDLLNTNPERFGQKYFICNRNFKSLSISHQGIWQKLQTQKDSLFLVELPEQEPKLLEKQRSNILQYDLKLGTQWFWSKDIIKAYKKQNRDIQRGNNNILLTGQPPVNNFTSGTGTQSFFSWLDTDTEEKLESSYDRFTPYMIWDAIHYYKRPFEENNRSIIEAAFYNIKFKIIDTEAKNKEYECGYAHSLFERHNNPNKFQLSSDDFLIQSLLFK